MPTVTSILVGSILKPIQFLGHFNVHGVQDNCTRIPNEWDYIVLVSKKGYLGYDMMVAYDEGDSLDKRTMYYGHWNDGTVS